MVCLFLHECFFFHFNLSCKKYVEIFLILNKLYCVLCRQDGIAPNFIQKPVTKQADNGKKLLFECQLTADPAPQISWFRDDKQITPGGMFLQNPGVLTKCKFQSSDDDTVIKLRLYIYSSSMSCSHITDIICPWGWGRVKMWDFYIFAALIIEPYCHRMYLCFTNTSGFELRKLHPYSYFLASNDLFYLKFCESAYKSLYIVHTLGLVWHMSMWQCTLVTVHTDQVDGICLGRSIGDTCWHCLRICLSWLTSLFISCTFSFGINMYQVHQWRVECSTFQAFYVYS